MNFFIKSSCWMKRKCFEIFPHHKFSSLSCAPKPQILRSEVTTSLLFWTNQLFLPWGYHYKMEINNKYYTITHYFPCDTCVCICANSALPAVPSWSHSAHGPEDMSANGCCCLFGALQEVSSLCPGVPHTHSAHLLQLARSPSTWIEIYQDQWRGDQPHYLCWRRCFNLIPLLYKRD